MILPTTTQQIVSRFARISLRSVGYLVDISDKQPRMPITPQSLDALEQSSDDSGWAHLGTFGSYLTKLQPDFDSRMFGFKKRSDLVRAKTDIFVIEERVPQGSTQKELYIRAK